MGGRTRSKIRWGLRRGRGTLRGSAAARGGLPRRGGAGGGGGPGGGRGGRGGRPPRGGAGRPPFGPPPPPYQRVVANDSCRDQIVQGGILYRADLPAIVSVIPGHTLILLFRR